jgi:hypothetical protein
MVQRSLGGEPPKSEWQVKCGFQAGTGTSIDPTVTAPQPTAAANEGARDIGELPGGQTWGSREPEPEQPQRWSTRTPAPIDQLIESYQALEETIPSFVVFELLAAADSEGDSEQDHPLLACAASVDPDTMYLHEPN